VKARSAATRKAAVVVPYVKGKDGWHFVLTPAGNTVRWTLRDGLETYLKFREHGVPNSDRLVFDTLQRLVDRLIRDVVAGKDAEKVFRLEPLKRRGERKDILREQAMCQEILRLTMLHAESEATAKGEVADAFGAALKIDIDMRTVERALKAWRSHFTHDDIVNYERSLKIRKLLA
jgi:hypothetical protein